MVPVPNIDALAGIGCYCTNFRGVGGSIKRQPSGFVVSEIAFESLSTGISKDYDSRHRYPLFVLEKQGIDSNHALIELEREAGLRLKVMGIKDAKAVTKQYASLVRPEPRPPAKVRTKHSTLTFQGFAAKPVSKDQLAGNAFRVELYDAPRRDLDDFEGEIDRIANFYGLQRFGSERLVSHLVGRELVRRNFEKAIELLLTHTTDYDSAFSREIREQMRDSNNYSRIVNALPIAMDIERSLLYSLIDRKDARSALRAIPVMIRRLFVQAYQGFIFNKCITMCLSSGDDVTHPNGGDLVFEMDGEMGFGRIVRFESGTRRTFVPAASLPGYSFQRRSGRFEKATEAIMKEEGVSPKDFYIKEMDELSQQGGYRQAPLWCKGFAHNTEPQVVSFRLPKGSYATILLREIMKPTDPIKSGF